MVDTQETIRRLRSCVRYLSDKSCTGCPFRYEEQVEQFLYRVCCAAEDAADELERLMR